MYRAAAFARSYAFCMDAFTSRPPPHPPCHSSDVNFVLMLRNLIQRRRAIYQTFIIQAHFSCLLGGGVGLGGLGGVLEVFRNPAPDLMQN